MGVIISPAHKARDRNFDLLGLGSVIGGVASLFGAGAGAAQQSQYNKNYLKGVRETNASNERINAAQLAYAKEAAHQQWDWQNQYYQMQKADNIDFWNMQNEYNDPSAQRERWEGAGFSPWSLAANGNAGVATSAPASPSGTSAPKADTPGMIGMQAPQALTSPLMQAFDSAAQGFSSFAQGLSSLVNADTNKDVGQSQIDLNKVKIDGETWNNRYLEQTFDSRVGMTKDQAKLTKVEADFAYEERSEALAFLKARKLGQDLSNRQQEELNKWLPLEKQVKFLTDVQGWLNAVEDGNIKKYQAKKILADILLTNAQTKNVNADTANKKENNRILKVEAAKAEALVGSIVETALLQGIYDRIRLTNDADIEGTGWNYWTKLIGRGITNTVGGIFSGSANFSKVSK